jgi:hypothetical protein
VDSKLAVDVPTTIDPLLIPFTLPTSLPMPSYALLSTGKIRPRLPRLLHYAESTSSSHYFTPEAHSRSRLPGVKPVKTQVRHRVIYYYSGMARGFYTTMANWRAAGDFAPIERAMVVEQASHILAGDSIPGEASTILSAEEARNLG